MSDEKLAQAFSEGRMIAAVDNVIFPAIHRFKEMRIQNMCGNFRAGKKDFIDDVAYITALMDLEVQLKQAQEAGNRAYRKLEEQKLGES
jgi:hypothetical protein